MVESHGGYLSQYEDVDVAWLHRVACQSLEEDGQAPDDVALLVTMLGGPRVVRFAWDAPFTYGRHGAKWYLEHHAFARALSRHMKLTVHAYAFDPDEVEQVVAYAEGRQVGGERLAYVDAELPEDEELDPATFARLQGRWPLGHLARVLGVAREALVRIPRQSTVLIDLGRPVPHRPLWQLLPGALGGESMPRASSS